MGHKIFISYKYHDSNVRKINNNSQICTVRDYVDILQNYFDKTDNIYKGENDGEDLSHLTDERIWTTLKNRIWDSTLTIVMISPNMNDGSNERNQWIPWEISYSLKEEARKNQVGNIVKSPSNAILALILPDRNGLYSYYLESQKCCSEGCRVLKTNTLFKILRKNMFNIKQPNKQTCSNGDEIYYGDSSYITSVKWDDFILAPQKYIDKAYYLQNSIIKYNIYKEID